MNRYVNIDIDVGALYTIQLTAPGGLVTGRELAWCVGGRGFNSQLGHTEDFKNGTLCFLAKHSAFKGLIKDIGWFPRCRL